ncbi:MAG: UDP-3-O-(3-hydroxymyristoyl)glucosamine N-acyltransferase [Candidatus Kapabacteria bacterium]|nr:UDP-3-O-(3-hydroxymyristoyl)glucosamine N-acyltransferase [Candidatus Kapabacteria bacterium]
MKVQISLNQIFEITGGELLGSTDVIINGIQGIEDAVQGDLTFFYNDKYSKFLTVTDASCVIIPLGTNIEPKPNQAFIAHKNPHEALVHLLNYLSPKQEVSSYKVHPTAIIESNVSLPEHIQIEAYVTIGKDSILQTGVKIMANTTIMENVKIGKNTKIYPNCVIHSDTEIGDNCIIYSGAVIGADGFGYLESDLDGSYSKIPQLGNVVLENHVEIGANTTIDRALIGTTRVMQGTKIDNLVHIAHNCEIGPNTAIAAQSGFSGSVRTGKNCKFGGQIGLAGHLEIADEVVLLAQSGVPKSITKKGVYFGSPAKEVQLAFKIEAILRNLPQMDKDLAIIKKRLSEIDSQ